MNTLLLYDFLYARGGAELVTLWLAASERLDEVIVASARQEVADRLPERMRVLSPNPTPEPRIRRAITTMHAFRSLAVPSGATVVYSGHFTLACAIPARARALYYAHSLPLGAVFSRGPSSLRLASRAHDAWLRRRIAHVHRIIANSPACARAHEACLGRPVEVIPPPVDLAGFRWRPSGGYYLSLARLEPGKRVECIIDAFLARPAKRLIVAGTGSMSAVLRRRARAAANIEFAGSLPREQVAALVSQAIATIHVSRGEALGLAVLESLAAGKPVIASGIDAHADQLLNGVTGILLRPDPLPHEIATAVDALGEERAAAMRKRCEDSVRSKGVDGFLDAVLGH